MNTFRIDKEDKRWDGYIPWFLRYDNYNGTGNYLLFFERLGHRLYQLFTYNEVDIKYIGHFAHVIESKSLQRYRADEGKKISDEMRRYFDPDTITSEARLRLENDPEEKELSVFLNSMPVQSLGMRPAFTPPASPRAAYDPDIIQKQKEGLESKVASTRDKRSEMHYSAIFRDRIGVLEVLLQALPEYGRSKAGPFIELVKDIRRYFAEACIMLDIAFPESRPTIMLLDEPLFQREVLDKLLPRLQSVFPERADELIKAYHDMLEGKNFDEIFISAYKTLEEIARGITRDANFQFTSEDFKRYFPKLHPTIQISITKLKAHRGDKGGHGRDAPKSFEMRYLLLTICNIALLLLDYE